MQFKYLGLLSLLILASCQNMSNELTLSIENPSDFDRAEVIEIDIEAVASLLAGRNESQLYLREKGSDEKQVLQWLDLDQDGISDQVLFIAAVQANASKDYVLFAAKDGEQPKAELKTYSRIVPERTDDYTWENDKVAFRTFGPEAQRRIEQNEYGGTLSSGIDLWLKKVNYSIIDSWYAKNQKEEGYYHIDHGEGYDPYHVGKSRGTGGIGVWENDSLITSKNFIAHRTIATGPLRTIFELEYAAWSDYNISETKRISLDLGSNFSKFEITLNSNNAPNYTIGIQTHELAGEEKLDLDQGVFRYWEPMGDDFLGEGIVLDSSVIQEAFIYESSTPDQSQLMIVTDGSQSVLTYYAGFAWTGSGQVSSVEDWDKMLMNQAEIINNPLKVELAK